MMFHIEKRQTYRILEMGVDRFWNYRHGTRQDDKGNVRVFKPKEVALALKINNPGKWTERPVGEIAGSDCVYYAYRVIRHHLIESGQQATTQIITDISGIKERSQQSYRSRSKYETQGALVVLNVFNTLADARKNVKSSDLATSGCSAQERMVCFDDLYLPICGIYQDLNHYMASASNQQKAEDYVLLGYSAGKAILITVDNAKEIPTIADQNKEIIPLEAYMDFRQAQCDADNNQIEDLEV